MKRLVLGVMAVVMFAAMALGTPETAQAQQMQSDVARLQSLINQGWRIHQGPSMSHVTVMRGFELQRRGVRVQIVGVRTWDGISWYNEWYVLVR